MRPFPYSERHLQCIWFDAALRPQKLTTANGEPVAVENPGRWNLEAGPDFLDAVLVVGRARRLLRGDVEVHIRPEDWRAHGHGAQAVYSRVVAHVTYLAPSTRPSDLPRGALEIGLQQALAADPFFSFENIDLSAYPHGVLDSRGAPCGRAVAGWTSARKVQLLEAAGAERLRKKTARIAVAVEERGPAQVFYEETMAALGFKHNRIPFRQLARRLPLDRLMETSAGRAVDAYALLLGVSGLIPRQIETWWDPETRLFVRSLWDIWWKQRAEWAHLAMEQCAWQNRGVRPANHPLRRLAAAAQLFSRTRLLCSQLLKLDTANPEVWFRETAGLFDGPPTIGYWTRRVSLGARPAAREQALLGPGRIAAILTNVAVPWLGSQGLHIAPLLIHLPAEDDSSSIRQTAFRFFGRDHNPALFAHGLRQQGLVQIYHDFCLSRRGCRDCQLAAALQRAAHAPTRSNC